MATRTFTYGGVNELASTAGNWDTAPADDDTIVISAGSNCCWDIDTSGWANGIAGFTITSHATTPAMVYFQTSGTTNYIKIKTGTTLNGTNAATKGRLLANGDGVWANSAVYPFAAKATIELITTGYIDATYLAIKLLCAEPTNPTINLSGNEAIGQTELSVATSVVGDIWADGDTVSICNLQQAQEHETRVIAAGGIAAGTITVTAGLTAAKTAGTYPAVMILCTRNIKIIGGSGNTISGLVGGTVNAWMYGATAGVGNAFLGCSNFTISGGYIGVGPTSGWASGWSRGLFYCYGFTWSGGTSSGNTYGLNTCYGFRLSNSTLDNTTNLYRVGEGELFNCLLTGTENSQYNATTAPVWNYVASYDHDQSIGAYKSWSMGGITLSKTTLPPGGYVTYYTLTCESATYHGFYQQRALLGPGDILTISGFVRKTDDHTGYAPRVQILDAAKDPLVDAANVALAEQIVSATETGWQSVSITYTNSTALSLPILIRGIAKRATGDVDFALATDIDTAAEQAIEIAYAASIGTGAVGGMIGNAYAPSTRVSPSGGVAVAVLVSARAVLTATSRSVREVYLLAGKANTSATYVNINAVASAGFEVPRAVGTVGNAGKCLRLPIASLTCLNFYGQTGDTVQVLYRD